MATDCTPSSLAALAAPYRGIAKQERDLVIIALLQAIARTNYTPAQLMELAKCYCGIPDKQLKAIQAALLCVATGGTPPCPECPPSGGCTYQDMQVAWTPPSAKLGESIGFFTYGDLGVDTITFDCATSLAGFDIENESQLTSLAWPYLVTVDPLNSQGAGLTVLGCANITSVSLPVFTACGNANPKISYNPLLTSIDISSLVPKNGRTIDFSVDALDVATVNLTLARCVANAAYVSGIVDLSGGTNAAPTGQGIIDKATLIGRGVTVNTN